jgi:CBS domain containing-hemolysin-like protein
MVNSDISYDELLQVFSENKFARMPVYDDTIDNIVGIINLKDFVFFSGDKTKFVLKNLVREAHFTYEYKNTSELFVEMRKDSIPMTIVLDEYGALAGLITMEDLLEEIVGDIRDEYDEDEVDDIQKAGENEYIVVGSTSLDDIDEQLKLPITSDDYDSIAGHIISLSDHFPAAGEHAEDQYAVYTVLEAENNRIDRVHIHVKDWKKDEEIDEE